MAAPARTCTRRFAALVCDDDRWLEAHDDPNVRRWLEEHDAKTRVRFGRDSVADALMKHVDEIWRTRKTTSLAETKPTKAKPAAKTKRAKDAIELVRADGTTAVLFPTLAAPSGYDDHELSPNGTFAYAERVSGGKDRRELLVRRTTPDATTDVLEGLEGSDVVWDEPRGGLYYTFTPADVPHAERFGAREIRFHRIGGPQREDVTIVPPSRDRNEASGRNPLGMLGRDHLLVRLRSAWDATTTYGVVDLGKEPKVRPLVQPDGRVDEVTRDGEEILALVRHDDGSRTLRRLRATDARGNDVGRIPAGSHYTSHRLVGKMHLVEYGAGFSQRFELRDPRFRVVTAWTAPPGTYERVRFEDGEIVSSRSGLLAIEEVARIDPETGARTPLRRVEAAAWEAARFEVDTFDATSEDGTRVPVTVLRDKNTPRDAKAPLWVYAYGGFRYPQFLHFQAIVAAWVSSGGTHAVVHARGGTEWGRDWNEAALRTHHFRSVTDAVAGVRALHARGYGTPARTLLHGRSHGGLVVSRAAVGWPDLARKVLAEVPLVDMIRYVEAGRGGLTEYGDPDDPGELPSLLHLSTYHAITPGTRYPAFFVTTAIGDERVDPMHPSKLVSALERAHPENEVHLKVDFRGGHLGGGGEPFERSMAEALAWLRTASDEAR